MLMSRPPPSARLTPGVPSCAGPRCVAASSVSLLLCSVRYWLSLIYSYQDQNCLHRISGLFCKAVKFSQILKLLLSTINVIGLAGLNFYSLQFNLTVYDVRLSHFLRSAAGRAPLVTLSLAQISHSSHCRLAFSLKFCDPQLCELAAVSDLASPPSSSQPHHA